MVRYIIAALLFFPVVLKAQQPVTFLSSDSITYQCYLKGDWDKLISTGKQAIAQNINYKRLRQRMGYALFATADYYGSLAQYEKALAFDKFDPDTREYLYYCAINTGNQSYARILAKTLTPELQKKLNIAVYKPADAIDLEYNYKFNDSQTRSNPTYLRAGISTLLGYRLKLYQSVSNYQQTVDTSLTKQPEYFALLTWSVTSILSLDVAYHYLNTTVGGYPIPGNLAYAGISAKVNRFTFGANGSILNSTVGNTKQFGLQAGVALPGKAGIYLRSGLNASFETGVKRLIFSQVAGARLNRSIWAEGTITLGELKNYNEYKSLYVYNSVDPTTFRSGLTLFWYLGSKATLFGNYTFDKKQITSTLKNYNQQSFSTGISWKL